MKKTLYALHPPLIMIAVGLMLAALVSGWFILFALLMVGDLVGRASDFRTFKSKPQSFYEDHVLDYYGRSWCGRSLMKALHPPARQHFHARGYRVWHMFPDNFFHPKRSPLLKRQFWINLFGGHAKRNPV